MFNLSGSEIVVILLLALVVLGPEKLPDALRRAGRTYAELKKMGNSFQAEVKSALDEPMKEMRETADLLRKAADFSDDGGVETGPGNRAVVSAAPATAANPPPTIDVAPAEDLDADLVNSTLSGGAPPTTVMPETANGSVTIAPDEETIVVAAAEADEPSTT